MKNKKTLLLIVVLLAFIAIFSNFLYLSNRKTVENLSINNLEKKIDNKDDFLLYVGRPSCPSCQLLSSKLNPYLRKKVFRKKVYYLNTDNIKSIKRKNEICNRLSVTSVPTFLEIKDGKISKRIVGYDVSNFIMIKKIVSL